MTVTMGLLLASDPSSIIRAGLGLGPGLPIFSGNRHHTISPTTGAEKYFKSDYPNNVLVIGIF